LSIHDKSLGNINFKEYEKPTKNDFRMNGNVKVLSEHKKKECALTIESLHLL
jgi:hypothetical protein